MVAEKSAMENFGYRMDGRKNRQKDGWTELNHFTPRPTFLQSGGIIWWPGFSPNPKISSIHSKTDSTCTESFVNIKISFGISQHCNKQQNLVDSLNGVLRRFHHFSHTTATPQIIHVFPLISTVLSWGFEVSCPRILCN